MKRKIGKKKGAALTLIGILGGRFVLTQLGENLFGSAYKKYIEPILTGKIYLIIKNKEELQENQILSIVEKNSIQIDIIFLLVTILGLFLLIAIVARNAYAKGASKKNAQEESLVQAGRAIVNDLDYVMSAQLYRYRIDSVGHGRKKKKKIIIDHIDSQYNDGMDINAIIHEEFLLEERYYKAVNQFLSRYNEFEKTNKNIDLQRAKEGVQNTLDALKNEFCTLTPTSIQENHCIHFAIYKGIQCTLGEEEWDSVIAGCSEEVCSALRTSKRTGCLPAILFQSVYTFGNEQSRFKKDRLYWSLVPNQNIMPIGYKKMLVVLTLSYEQIEQMNERLIYSELVKTVHGYLTDLTGGNQSGTDNG